MDGYLLDTSVLIPLVRPKHRAAENVKQRLRRVPDDAPVYLSVAALAELFVGPLWGGRHPDEARGAIEERIASNGFMVREITKHTAVVYGDLKARLMLKYGRQGKRKAGKWPENWDLPAQGAKLGIDEFDLLMVTHALEYRLVLVRNDDMRRIREGIRDVAAELQIEDWTELS